MVGIESWRAFLCADTYFWNVSQWSTAFKFKWWCTYDRRLTITRTKNQKLNSSRKTSSWIELAEQYRWTNVRIQKGSNGGILLLIDFVRALRCGTKPRKYDRKAFREFHALAVDAGWRASIAPSDVTLSKHLFEGLTGREVILEFQTELILELQNNSDLPNVSTLRIIAMRSSRVIAPRSISSDGIYRKRSFYPMRKRRSMRFVMMNCWFFSEFIKPNGALLNVGLEIGCWGCLVVLVVGPFLCGAITRPISGSWE